MASVRHKSLSDVNNNNNKKPGYARHYSITEENQPKVIKSRNLSVADSDQYIKSKPEKENIHRPRIFSLRSVSEDQNTNIECVKPRPRLGSKLLEQKANRLSESEWSGLNKPSEIKWTTTSVLEKSGSKPSKIPVPKDLRKSLEQKRYVIDLPPTILPENVVNIEIESGMYEYSGDLIAYLRELETETVLPDNYLEGGSTLPNNRALVIDWMIQVNHYFNFYQETLFYGISLLDTVISRRDIKGERLQLVAVACIWIASKLEEYFPADLGKLSYLTQNSYTIKQIIKMEFIILGVLKFKLHLPCYQTILNRYARAALRFNDTHFVKTCQYLIESHAVDERFPTVRPSLQVSGGVLTAIILLHAKANPDLDKLDLDDLWTPTLMHYTKYSVDSVLPVCAGIIRTMVGENSKYDGARKKYTSASKHSKLSLLPHLCQENLENCQDLIASSIQGSASSSLNEPAFRDSPVIIKLEAR